MVIRLNDLLVQARRSKGMAKVLMLGQIRVYVAKKSARDLLDEINAINSIEDCNLLLGAGMHGLMYVAVTGRRAQLTEF